MMNRRNLLKLLALTPLAPLALKAQALRTPTPVPAKLPAASASCLWPSQSGSLTLLLGPPKTGKSLLVRAWVSRMSRVVLDPEPYVLDLAFEQALTHRANGSDVLLTVTTPRWMVREVGQVDEQVAFRTGSFKMSCMADRTLLVDRFELTPEGGKWWFVTLKDRWGALPVRFEATATRQEMWLRA